MSMVSLVFSYAPRNMNPPIAIQHTRGTKPENKLLDNDIIIIL